MSFRWIMLRRALVQKKAKSVLIVLAVTMGASVVSALLNLQTDLRQRMNRELRDYGPNVVITAKAENSERWLNAGVLTKLQGLQVSGRIIAYTPQIFVPATVNDRSTVVVGVDLQALRKLFPNWNWQITPRGDEGAIIGARLAAKLGEQIRTVKIAVSDQTAVMTVLGKVEGGEAEDDHIFIDIGAAQRISGNNGRFHSIAVSAAGEIPDVQRDFNAFVKQQPGVEYQLIRKIAAAEMIILDKITSLMALIVSLIFVILFFCIQTTVSAILLSRQGEIALLRVLGARRRQILTALTAELLILGMVGGLVGYLLGIFMSQILGTILFQTFIAPRLFTFLITLGFSLVMMVLSSILPMTRAVNRQAASVLKEA